MVGLGVNLPVIEKLLNHVSGSFAGIVKVYQRHSFADEKRAAMAAWARHVHRERRAGEYLADDAPHLNYECAGIGYKPRSITWLPCAPLMRAGACDDKSCRRPS
jgi:hypothetical protein